MNKELSLERRRLTLAHELAHRLSDCQGMSEKEAERAANLFAGAFLMPKEHLLREVGKRRQALGYTELIGLKKSIASAARPCLCACDKWESSVIPP